MSRKHLSQSAGGRDRGQGHFVTVGLPTPYEGVGRALRKSFAPRESLPDDMMRLLAKLR